MATAAAITIKKNDTVTDIVWALVAASGGDKSPAVWRSTTVTGTPGQQPEIRVTTQNNGSNNGRKFVVQYTYPRVYTDSASSLTKVLNRANLKVEGIIPLDMDATTANEFGAQFGNLMASVMLKGTFQSGYAPT